MLKKIKFTKILMIIGAVLTSNTCFFSVGEPNLPNKLKASNSPNKLKASK